MSIFLVLLSIFCFESTLCYNDYDLHYDAGNGHAWVYGSPTQATKSKNLCSTIHKRECSEQDLLAIRDERRNVCEYAFLGSRIQQLSGKKLWLAVNVNSDTFADDDCGNIGRLNGKFVKEGKKWCCETKNPWLTEQKYQKQEVNAEACGTYKKFEFKRWDGSSYVKILQQRVCDWKDLQSEFSFLVRNSLSGWVTKDGQKVVAHSNGKNVISSKDQNAPVWCCKRKSLNIGEKCLQPSDCVTWICHYRCLKSFSTAGWSDHKDKSSGPDEEMLDTVRLVTLIVLGSTFTFILCLKVSVAFSPVNGICCLLCRCRERLPGEGI